MNTQTRPHLVRVRGGFKAVCPCGWTSDTKRSQSDVLDRLSAHQDGIRAKPGEARCWLAVPLPLRALRMYGLAHANEAIEGIPKEG